MPFLCKKHKELAKVSRNDAMLLWFTTKESIPY